MSRTGRGASLSNHWNASSVWLSPALSSVTLEPEKQRAKVPSLKPHLWNQCHIWFGRSYFFATCTLITDHVWSCLKSLHMFIQYAKGFLNKLWMTISKVASQNVSEIFSRSNGLMWQSCFSISRTTCINAIYKQIESDIAKTRQNTKRYLGLDQRSQRLLVPCRSLSKQCSSPSQCRSYPRSLDSCNLVAADSLKASGKQIMSVCKTWK